MKPGNVFMTITYSARSKPFDPLSVKQSEINNGLNVSEHMYVYDVLFMSVLNAINGTDLKNILHVTLKQIKAQTTFISCEV